MAPTDRNPEPLGRPIDVYRRLIGYSLEHWRLLTLAMVCMALTAASETGFAALMKPLLDGSFVERDPSVIRWAPFALIGIFLVRGITGFISGYFMAYVGRLVIKTLRGEMFSKLLRMPVSYYDRNSSGQLLSRLTYNVEQVAQTTTDSITIMVRDLLTLVGLVGWMFWLEWRLAMAFLVVSPFITIFVTVITKRFRGLSRRIQGSMGDVTQVAEEVIDGHHVVKIFGGEEYETAQFERINERNRRLHMKMVATQQASVPIVQVMVAMALAFIVWLATHDEVLESVTVGTFVSFMMAMMMLLTPIKRLTTINAVLQRGIAAGQNIFALLDSSPEPDNGSLHLARARGAVEYRDVRFRYEAGNDEVLKGVSLRIEPGETVALVGRSGSGKTTLANLLPRFYEPLQGEVMVDGVDIRQYRLADLRAQISYVGQDVVLFNDTVERNIAYGCLEDVGEADIVRAAEAAHAMEFIRRLPQGLKTPVGEDGVLLSGGQRQRLAIARALLKNAPILILDEATSSLDTESERHIQAALETLLVGRTTLVIAHRLSTIEKADRIVVMSEGRVVESGRHAELIACDGAYARLHRLQFREESAKAAAVGT